VSGDDQKFFGHFSDFLYGLLDSLPNSVELHLFRNSLRPSKSGQDLSFRPDPFAHVGAGLGIIIGEGDLLRVAEEPDFDLVCTILGTVPDVEAVGEEGVMLGAEEDEDEDGRAALAEVLGFGTFILARSTAVAAGDGLAEVAPVCSG
jgi:hypothetical protein